MSDNSNFNSPFIMRNALWNDFLSTSLETGHFDS